jgi:hypothetical protein
VGLRAYLDTEARGKSLLFKSSYAFRTQEWFNLARDDVVRLRRTPPLVWLVGWLGKMFCLCQGSNPGCPVCSQTLLLTELPQLLGGQ